MSTSSSSTSSSATLQTSSRYRLTGTNLYSGLDTDSIIKALVSNTQSKIDKQGQLEQIAEWKRTLYRGVASDMETFENTYFSYTSATNLLSSTFFKTTDITSSSDAVSATGDIDSAKNLTINKISQLAKQASLSCSHKVSDETIDSGSIQSDWTQSTVGGNSLVVSYNGTDYTLTLSNSVKLDSNNMSATDNGKNVELQKIVDGLNDQINATSDLKGKVSFALNADNSISLSSNTAYNVGVSAYKTSYDSASGPAFLKTLGLTDGSSGKTVTGSAIDTNVSTSGLFNQTISSSSYLKFKLKSGSNSAQEYTVKLGENMTISGATDGGYAVAIASQLQKQIDADKDLSGKLKAEADPATGKITFSSQDGSDLSISGGSENLLNGLGITPTSGDPTVTSVESSGVTAPDLFKSYLGDTLAGNTVTFSLDGVSKAISFDATDESQYSSADGIATYLQKKLDNAFGANKVQVTDNSGTIQFKTSDTSSVLNLSSASSSDILDKYGALRISSGETNRAETSKTLSELSGELGTALKAGSDGKYALTINGKTLSFDGDTALSSVISQINDDTDMGVTLSYSQTTDTFRITADDSGSQGKIYYSDVNGGNLASSLFGSIQAGDLSSIQSGKLANDSNSSFSIADDSVYAFTLGDTQKSVTIAKGDYTNLSDFASNVQSQMDSAFGSGQVTVTANTDGTLSFASAGNQQLSITSQSASDPLQISASSNLKGYTAGQDLKMNVTDNGKTSDIVRSSNTTTLDSVSLTISSTTDTAVTFSSKSNVDDLATKITDYVNAYNKIIDKVNTLTTESQERNTDHQIEYQPLTDAEKEDMTSDEIDKWNTEAQKGLLQNDDTLNGILDDLRTAMTSAVDSAGLSLSDLGISTQAYDYKSGGQLTVDTTQLKKTLTDNPDAVTKMFTDDDGVSTRVKNALDKYVGTFGGDGELLLRAGSDTDANDTSQLTTQIKQYQSTISDLKDQLETEEDRYWDKFTAMEQSLSTLTAQSNYLSSMFSDSSSS